jgi:hypothetical protein
VNAELAGEKSRDRKNNAFVAQDSFADPHDRRGNAKGGVTLGVWV